MLGNGNNSISGGHNLGTLPGVPASCVGDLRSDDGGGINRQAVGTGKVRCTSEAAKQLNRGKGMNMSVVRTAMNEKGFSLLELLIAIMLLTTGLLAVASMQETALGANGIANKNTLLASLAQGVQEDIMSWQETDTRLQANVANAAYDLDPATAGTTYVSPGTIGTFTATYSITANAFINGATIANVAQIDVTVTDAKSNRSISLTSYKRWTN